MTNPSQPLNIRNALDTLMASQNEWLKLAEGDHPTGHVQAHAARTQCLIQAAAVHVLLDIAESLRAIASQGDAGE